MRAYQPVLVGSFFERVIRSVQTTPANVHAEPRRMHRTISVEGKITSMFIVVAGLRASLAIIKSPCKPAQGPIILQNG